MQAGIKSAPLDLWVAKLIGWRNMLCSGRQHVKPSPLLLQVRPSFVEAAVQRRATSSPVQHLLVNALFLPLHLTETQVDTCDMQTCCLSCTDAGSCHPLLKTACASRSATLLPTLPPPDGQV